jgi:hypothetical protein
VNHNVIQMDRESVRPICPAFDKFHLSEKSGLRRMMAEMAKKNERIKKPLINDAGEMINVD